MKLDINQDKIYNIRGHRVMFDYDVATLYETTVKNLNLAVNRNPARFPKEIMFELTKLEWESWKSLIETYDPSSLENEKLKAHEALSVNYLPHAFTDQGLAMLSSVLDTEKAIMMNKEIINAFLGIRRVIMGNSTIQQQVKQIKKQTGSHDDLNISNIYSAIENLLVENAVKKNWENRKRIGFKIST
jgi:hypothetical protein